MSLGNSGVNTSDKQFKQLASFLATLDKEKNKKAAPWITGTFPLTKGTYAAKGKVLGIGAEYTLLHNETDILGFRDNKNVAHGEKTFKNGMSASFAGVGAGITVESARPMENGELQGSYSVEQKISRSGISAVSKAEEGQTSTEVEHELLSFKVGWYLGIEGSVSLHMATNNSTANAPPSGDPIASDKTRVQIYVPDNVPIPNTNQ